MNFIIKILIFSSLIFLASCAHMNSSFDCPMKNGVRCESLDEVNARIDRGEFGTSAQSISTPVRWSKQSLRDPETVMRIWIAPFEDTSGNYHQASSVYTVVHAGHWAANSTTAINGDED